MCSNARTYNVEGSEVYKDANQLEALCKSAFEGWERRSVRKAALFASRPRTTTAVHVAALQAPRQRGVKGEEESDVDMGVESDSKRRDDRLHSGTVPRRKPGGGAQRGRGAGGASGSPSSSPERPEETSAASHAGPSNRLDKRMPSLKLRLLVPTGKAADKDNCGSGGGGGGGDSDREEG
eukprot:Rmarinus@m.13560